MLTPSDDVTAFVELNIKLHDLVHAIDHQRAFGWIMNIRFDDKRIDANFLHAIGLQSIGFVDNAVTNGFDGLAFE